MDTAHRLLCILVKDFTSTHTVSSLAQQLQLSRWGVWKIFRKLKQEGLIILTPAGKGKTSTHLAQLNWKNTLTEKTASYALVLEAERYRRWKFSLAKLENHAKVVILFGSILTSPQTAGDIDLLTVATEKKLLLLEKILRSIQQTQEKKIHSHNLTAEEFIAELQKPNKIFLDALRRGVVLFGQEKFVQYLKGLS